MKYHLLREQSHGCDYTIGCGLAIDALDATSMSEAIEEAKGLLVSWGDLNPDSESAIATALVLEVANVCELDVDALRADLLRQRAAQEAARTAEAERAEFERLKAKFAEVGAP